MTTYNAPEDVSGEIATTEGLVAFSYAAGEIMPAGDQAILDHLVSLGLIKVAAAKATSKKSPITEAADVPADAQEEK
jgi:hypothetical protein